MATTYGSAAVDLSSRPYAYIAIPLCVTLALVLFAIVIHSKRRKRLAKLHPVRTNPQAQRAHERDVQRASQLGALGQPGRRVLATRRWSSRNGGRWAWIPTQFATPGEEGLNEYGEAPPPYEGRGAAKDAEDSIVEDVEMQIRPSGSRTGEGSRSAGSEDGGNPQAHPQGQQGSQVAPPAYGEPPTRGLAFSPGNNGR
jgi:hypothetical protein